ncbi:MAG TPA: YqhA family protein, partial [Methylotenera sp.]|nr:YqhA family protein [Methylotenera sp.]
MQENNIRPSVAYKQTNVMSNILFGSRWLQLPLYLGLIVAQAVYVFFFGVELVHLVAKANTLVEADIMLIVLGLIDVVMISNLLIMVIVGGYET